MQLSAELNEKLFGDEAVLQYLEDGRKAFDDGDRSALFSVLCLCANFQAVLPEWAADALLAMEKQLEDGTLADFNEAFGDAGEHRASRRRRARLAKQRHLVLSELQRLRLSGAALDVNTFDEVVEALRSRNLKLNRRDVQDIYQQHGVFLRNLPRNPDPNHRYAMINGVIRIPRRTDRPVLADKK
jgi:hypothetical protein